MPTIAERLKLLKGRDPASVAVVLAEALTHADRAELGPLAEAAISSNRAGAVASVIRRWHEFEPAQKNSFARARVDLDAAIRVALARSTRRVRSNVIQIIVQRGDSTLAGHLADLIELAEEGTAEHAAEALLELVSRAAHTTDRAHHLDAAVAKAARGYERHRHEPVLIALALRSACPGPAVRSLLAEADHPVGLRLRSVGDRVDRPLVRRNLLRWLTDDLLQHSATRGLARLTSVEAFADALRDGHLLLSSRRRRALRRVDRPLRCLPPLRIAVELDRDAQRWLPLLASRLPLSANARRRFLADSVALPSPIARWRAVEALIDENRACNQPVIEWLCRDPVPFVAHTAARGVLAHHQPVEAWLERMVMSQHGAVARRALCRLTSRDADSFYHHLRWLAPARRRAIAWFLLGRDRDAFIDATRRCMAGDDDRAVQAIVLARRLRIVADLRDTLIDRLGSERSRIASAAVAALGDDRSEASMHAVVTALDHPDGRVQANALEALARIRRDERVLLSRTSAAHNRLRANAVHALVRQRRREGVEQLNRMLLDGNPLHRVSAIWAAKTSRARESAKHVERLATSDPSPEVRTRATSALRFLRSNDRSTAEEVMR